jgi:hypothetical protein
MASKEEIAKIQVIVGEEMLLKTSPRNGNVQVNIAEMAKQGGREKLELLHKSAVALEAKGYEVDFQNSYKDRNGNWQPWPCLWVNFTKSAQVQTGPNLSELYEKAIEAGIDIEKVPKVPEAGQAAWLKIQLSKTQMTETKVEAETETEDAPF